MSKTVLQQKKLCKMVTPPPSPPNGECILQYLVQLEVANKMFMELLTYSENIMFSI